MKKQQKEYEDACLWQLKNDYTESGRETASKTEPVIYTEEKKSKDITLSLKQLYKLNKCFQN